MLHQWAAVFSLGAGLALVGMAPTPRIALAVGVYAFSLVLLFTVSALYHRIHWRPQARAWMRRADHSSIFILIAGTYTPIALIALPDAVGNRIFGAAWVGAAIAILACTLWERRPKWLTATMALAVGWTLVPFLPDAARALGPLKLTFLLAGGVAYTAGALAYATRWPRLRPKVFGYHELFHLLTLIAAVLHFVTVVLVSRTAFR